MKNIHFEKGESYLKDKKFQEAEKAFTLAIEQEPNRAEIYGERAICYLNLEKNSLALIDLNKAVELQPDYGYRYAARAFCKSHLGDLDGAIEDYQKAVELDPKDDISYNNLGLVLENKGRKEAAERYFKQADKISKEKKGLKDNFTDLIPEQKIKTSQSTENTSKENIEKNTSITETENLSFFEILKSVFTKKHFFKAYLQFLKNSFKKNDK